ncbi:Short-chain dehydrogenase/reductase SDR [Ostreococcus tauri]|uniref:Forever young oxidoreductase n=1 Tax=Ostreococcus tauri TaxID=70448 RepID=A0A090N2V3_OSTTA|nr:Short-chain dehydrogenase/reductase SDR [Ostreococcus tauri]OUS47932.1 forever young oxidoreductase [Ostreococcus tauri]CEF96888.1 Short-chain dehydrogenase/reductase SDR [Ostreococcus tauri]|eukprot:XP_022838360.1 Short-chain dehydrogenase/reductase SDR [Ostreococcus tauri]
MLDRLLRQLDVLRDVLLQRWNCRRLPHRAIDIVDVSVRGKTFVVTGPTSGIGVTTAHALAKRGARVILACRTVKKGEDLLAQWITESEALRTERPNCRVMQLDLDSLESVREFAKEFVRSEGRLDVLINNAGIFDMSGSYVKTRDGREQHLQANFLAPALLTMSLLDVLRSTGAKTGDARVVFVSSKLHELSTGLVLDDMDFNKRPYAAAAAYGSSKLAEVMFVRALDKRLRVHAPGTRALVLHPGNIVTGVVRTLPWIIQFLYRIIMSHILLTPDQGARASLYCATQQEAVSSDTNGPYLTSECVENPPSKYALDEEATERLWKYTLQELDLDDSFD